MVAEEPSSVPAFGLAPNILTGYFIQLFRFLFSSPENIANPDLHKYIYTDEVSRSKIKIEDLYRWKPEDIQADPGIFVRRGDWQIQQIGLGDQVMKPTPLAGSEDFEGAKTIIGQHHFFVVGTTPLDVELIATEVLFYMIQFTPQIRKDMCIQKFQVSGLGKMSRSEDANTDFIVPLTVAYQLYYNWTLQRQAPEWKRLVFSTNIVNKDVVEETIDIDV